MSLVTEMSETWMTASIRKKMMEIVIISSRALVPSSPRRRSRRGFMSRLR
jgi:hypothetical protein